MRFMINLLLLSGLVFQGNAAPSKQVYKTIQTTVYTGRYIMVTSYENDVYQSYTRHVITTEFDTAKACLDFIPKMRKYIGGYYVQGVIIGCEEKGE